MRDRLSRRDFLSWFGVAMAGSAVTDLSAQARRTRPPNIVFILIDDLGWRDLGCYGSTYYETPNIDRLASRGMRFTDGYAACTVCSPTRASILTGKYPARLHLTDWIAGHERPRAKLAIPDWTKVLKTEEVTIAEALKSLASPPCANGFIGKWHLGPTEDTWPLAQGFDVNVGGYSRGQPPSYFSPYRIPTMTDGPTGEYLTDRHADDAVDFIESNSDRPFMLYLSMYAVHTPLQAKVGVIEKYRRKAAANPREAQGNPVYAAMIESMDACVGRVMRALEQQGIADDTVVFFTGDNGGLIGNPRRPVTSNAPLRAGKGSAYEGGVREPFIVLWPGVTRPGSICAEPVISVDVYPTILEMVTGEEGRRPNGTMDGVSLVPLLRGQARLERRALYWHYPHYHPGGATPYGAVRMGDWKLIQFFEDNRVELYNLHEDIGETVNLAAENPEMVVALRSNLEGWRADVGAQMPRPNPDYDPDSADTRASRKRATRRQAPFEIVRDAKVKRYQNGWEISAAREGTALKALEIPITTRATILVDMKTRLTREQGWQNGFVALGESGSDDDLVMAGLYIGRQSLNVFRGLTDAGSGTSQSADYTRIDTHRLSIDVDIERRSLVLRCADRQVTHRLPGDMEAIRYIGYHAIKTRTWFGELMIRR